MLKKFIGMFSGTIYVQLREERIKIVLIEEQVEFDEPPYIAITNGEKKIVKAVGHKAKLMSTEQGVEVYNPFSHPRVLVNDFEKAQKILTYGIETVYTANSKKFLISPIVIIHPMEKLEGGMTQVEWKIYRELGLAVGAREVYLHVGSELDILNFNIEDINEPKFI